ncbi:MAG: iron ABC transporter permease, partial [Spirochaetales bacterium]|nr:iron ABC transporter permease [Spirochaetales bacterium]
GKGPSLPRSVYTVVYHVRLPRVIAAFAAGAALSVSGASYQGLFRNPMASPDLLGATAGASFGAALGITLSLGTGGIELLSFLCGLGAVFLTWIIGRKGGDSGRTVMLILGGMLVSTLFTSLITLIKYTADPYGKLPQITYWLMGSLASVTPREGLLLLAVVTAASLPLYLLRWRLNVLAFDDEEARTLGLDVTALRVGVIILATLMTSAVVSSAGQIGWVGLLVPHLARMIWGPGYRSLLPGSLLLGGIFLLLTDTAARCLGPVEIPLGVLTSFAGAPLFLYFLFTAKRGWS